MGLFQQEATAAAAQMPHLASAPRVRPSLGVEWGWGVQGEQGGGWGGVGGLWWGGGVGVGGNCSLVPHKCRSVMESTP